jgi:hypothetical protein
MLAAFHRHLVSAPFLEEPLTAEQMQEHQDIAQETIAQMREEAGLTGTKRVLFDNGGIGEIDSTIKVAESELSGAPVKVLFRGDITNLTEIGELYGIDGSKLDAETDTGATDYASLMLHLYTEGFADIYGDDTDQPATLLGALEP